jgi:uncharacterized membrane protein
VLELASISNGTSTTSAIIAGTTLIGSTTTTYMIEIVTGTVIGIGVVTVELTTALEFLFVFAVAVAFGG